MTHTRTFFAFLIVVFSCKADHRLPAPKLSYRWIDPFTVNISWFWEKPNNLPVGCKINYKLQETYKGGAMKQLHTKWRYFIDSYLTEDTGSDHWKFNIQAIGIQSCDGWNESKRESIIINTPKPRAKVVKDFKCLIEYEEMNCSWMPVNSSLDLTLSYRFCGESKEDINHLKKCAQPYRNDTGGRRGCYLKVDAREKDVCVLVKTKTGLNTFKPELVVPLPKLNITEDGDSLNLTWTPPDVGKSCGWEYEVCYQECNEHKPCQTFKPNKETKNHGPMQIRYDKSCLYELEFRVRTDQYCVAVFSDGSAVVTYGSNKRSDGTLTVVAVVIPIILSACVILSCYCFRRHRANICPIIPDPSSIFKEMMVNGNKELKITPGSLYTHVPEHTDSCNIALVTENGVLQQNS